MKRCFMLLDEQRETPFDLRFRLFGTHIRIHPFFWLVTVFFSFDLLSAPEGGFDVLLVWVACVFISILLHEFGHVWMGQVFGSRGHIVLQGMCGLAIGVDVPGRWRRILVSLAGPGIELLLSAALLGLLIAFDPRPLEEMARSWGSGDFLDRFRAFTNELIWQPGLPRLGRWALHFLFFINFWWALINLLPVWPLDGGQVSRELFVWQNRTTGARNALALSLVTALALSLNSLSVAMNGPRIPYFPAGGRFFIAFFAIFAFESFLLLQMENARSRAGWRDPDEDDRLPWERDPDEWKRG